MEGGEGRAFRQLKEIQAKKITAPLLQGEGGGGGEQKVKTSGPGIDPSLSLSYIQRRAKASLGRNTVAVIILRIICSHGKTRALSE